MHISASRALIGLAAAGCVFLTVGCSGNQNLDTTTSSPSASQPATPEDTTPTATASVPKQTLAGFDSIAVTGDYNTQPSVTAPYPFKVDKTICQTTIQGNGVDVSADAVVELQYTGIDASSGTTFDSSFFNGQTLLGQNGYFVPGFNQCLTGQKVGSRVVMMITGKDGYDSAGGNSQVGIAVGDTLLFVVDVIAAQYSGPTGQHMADGNTWVSVTDKNGVPTAKINPGVAAPTDLQSTVLVQGTGRAIDANDAVYVNFLEMDFATGKVIDSSYNSAGGAQVDLLANLIPGWRNAMVGQPMGSRLLIIVPGNLAYPQGNATPSIKPNATLVFVVDVLFSFIPQQQSSQ